MTTFEATPGVNQGFVLTPEPATTRQLLVDVWRSRQLLFMLSRKEFFVRFRRTSGGVLWSILLPLIQAVVMAAVLSRLVRFDTKIDYPLHIYSGTLAFSFMVNGVANGVTALIGNSGLSTKIYFPRLIFPLVIVGSGFYSLVPGLGVLLVMAVVLGTPLDFHLLLLVPAVALLCLLTMGLAAVLSVIQVYVRDLRYIVQAATQPWFYVTPVVFPLVAVGRFRNAMEVNPAAGVVELFRAALGGADPGWGTAVAWSGGWTAVLLITAVVLFRRLDRVAVDLL